MKVFVGTLIYDDETIAVAGTSYNIAEQWLLATALDIIKSEGEYDGEDINTLNDAVNFLAEYGSSGSNAWYDITETELHSLLPIIDWPPINNTSEVAKAKFALDILAKAKEKR